MEQSTLLTWQTAMVAVLAGVIVLSIAAYLHLRAKRRREAAEAVQRRGSQIVRKLRHCPFFSKEQDRQLAVKFAKELDDFIAKEGYTLERLGITRAEVTKIVQQTTAQPASESAKRQLGQIAEHRERKLRDSTPPPRKREPIVLPEMLGPPVMPSELTTLAEQVEPYGATFTEADFASNDVEVAGEVEIDLPLILVPVDEDEVPTVRLEREPPPESGDFDLSDFEDPSPRALDHGDPIRALQAAGNAELDAFIDDRIAAIQLKDQD